MFPDLILCKKIYKSKYLALFIKYWKIKLLIGRSLLQTVIILAGNWTQVTFSGIIPLDHQDLHR